MVIRSNIVVSCNHDNFWRPLIPSVLARPLGGDRHERQVRTAETRLLYENASTGIVVTIVIASLLAYAQSDVISVIPLSMWWLYMVSVSAARFMLVRRYWRVSPSDPDSDGHWNLAFVSGAALGAAGWAAAAIVLYSPASPMNEAFLVFVVGGVMLGGASLLAARPEAFLTFLVPTGVVTAVRLAVVGDQPHLMMGFLAGLFTAATVASTWR